MVKTHRTYSLGGETGSSRIQLWMQSHPGDDSHERRVQPERASRPTPSRPARDRG
jgi:hypothetical protein